MKFGIPLLFVFLWSTGFIGAKFGLPGAEPFTFLAVRMFLTWLILLLLLPAFNVSWPRNRSDYLHLSIVGVLIHGIYLGGVFSAIHHGLPASVCAIIVGLQPLMTVLIAAFWLKESLTRIKLYGLLIGFLGVFLVVGEQGMDGMNFNRMGILLSAAALVAISVGTIYQKKFCSELDLLPGVIVQYGANTIFMGLLAFSLETRIINWNLQFILALSWLVFALSIGAVLLLMKLIRQGEAGNVASLFYLVPPFVAIEAWFLFEERFGMIAFTGILCCVTGVAMVLKTHSQQNR